MRIIPDYFYQGLLLPDVTGQDWYDSARIADLILKSIKNVDYDLAIPFYVDFGFGVPPLGGVFDIPNDKFKAWVDAVHEYGKYPLV
ncbi:MAG: hypothetical protein M0P74_15365 [Syntrophales bacterium]|jgi:hypothetical protein|nr:hypothetical protein [Syntrophales bacterium]